MLLAGLKHYESRRGYADARSVSRVSPYLRWGQLSPRHMLQRVAQVIICGSLPLPCHDVGAVDLLRLVVA